jgi:hypothetical protein
MNLYNRVVIFGPIAFHFLSQIMIRSSLNGPLGRRLNGPQIRVGSGEGKKESGTHRKINLSHTHY